MVITSPNLATASFAWRFTGSVKPTHLVAGNVAFVGSSDTVVFASGSWALTAAQDEDK